MSQAIQSQPSIRSRRRLSLDGWAVLTAFALAALVWANVIHAITW